MIIFAVLFYGLTPVTGAFIERRRWRLFRRRFSELRRRPQLDYDTVNFAESGDFRFTGTFESIDSETLLWIRSKDLTVQADLQGARTYVFPNKGDEGDFQVFDPGEEIPERIRWDRISSLTGDAKVFVGGPLVKRGGRNIFVSLPGNPLLIIFYEGSEKALAVRAVRAGRHRNEFFNFLTPIAFVLGAFSQIIIAVSLLSRPIHRFTVISAFIALFTPLIPFIPPGLFFTVFYRRLWWRARLYRSYRDLARFPREYFAKGESQSTLPNGEIYIQKLYDTIPFEIIKKVPLLIPASEKKKKSQWHFFGTLHKTETDADFPKEPLDEFAISCILPGDSETMARSYNRKAYFLEVISWLLLLAAIGINVFFISLILMQLGI
ncbi:MAG: hypothetical protein LBI14_09655 [Treponema sp.]|nr:hypothetical protein [Treponema sp.]